MARRNYLSIYIQPELRERLDRISTNQGVSLSRLCERLLTAGVERIEGKVSDVTREEFEPLLELARMIDSDVLSQLLLGSICSTQNYTEQDSYKNNRDKISEIVKKLMKKE